MWVAVWGGILNHKVLTFVSLLLILLTQIVTGWMGLEPLVEFAGLLAGGIMAARAGLPPREPARN